jgi:hypothetical protein
MAPEGAEFVQTRYTPDCNILATLESVINAGLVPWPKQMQNLRATRETKLGAAKRFEVFADLGSGVELLHRALAFFRAPTSACREAFGHLCTRVFRSPRVYRGQAVTQDYSKP